MTMLYDLRCLQLTVRRNTSFPQPVTLQHGPQCQCEKTPTIIHRTVVVTNAENGYKEFCPCGAKQHKGMCKDAIIAEQGREVPKWKS